MPTTTATTTWTSIGGITVGEGTNAVGKAVPKLSSDIIVYQESDGSSSEDESDGEDEHEDEDDLFS